VHTETACKEQPAICLWHMGRGPNDCRRQPRLQSAVAEGKNNAETRQYKEDQFWALEDRHEASPTQISNLYCHNGNESRNPYAERRTHGRQHHAQAHATRWVDGFKLDISKFQENLQPEEFMDQETAVGEVLDFKEVPEDRRVSLVATKLMDEDLSVDWASPPIYDIYPDEEESLEEVNLSDSLAILYEDYVHYMVDKGSKDKYSDFNVEIIDYIDFLGIDNILFNFHNNDGFGVVGNNYMFKREVPADSFLGIFMARGKEKEQEKYGKSKVLPSGVWGRHNNRQGTPLMKSIIIIMGRGLVVKLRREEWNGLTGHPKDRGKDRPNLRTNSLQHGENDADQTKFGASLLLRSSAHRVPYVNFMFLVVKPPLFPCFNSIRVLRVFISLLYYV
jgi:hypothetical protein